MQSASAVLGVLILAAGLAAAADNQKGATTRAGASPDEPPSTPASPAGAITPATLDVDRFVSLHTRILDLENRLKHRDPVVEQSMWRAFWIVGLALAIAWAVGKIVQRSESERETKLAMWKELVQAVKVPASANADPQVALNEFAIRVEAVGDRIQGLTGSAERAIREADARITALSPAVAELEKKLQAAGNAAKKS